ncbi:hypothetical protein CHGG_07165 [Chaetomium globosum CBS 148.51]|uniref:MIF4G domain-containing protein n=1 Tax=Chaetomium globosum (strain ATCC 6205 / CBS 148.51 / DSM 1962 / NBRC 6347 / NRRL 1970) TaxID=306901 RepID=Q2GXY9_CHAGB|nr:uncharacterized protein CHGG_07165 [Chaetomium globosum CBS 148.51]EAQ85912.1 hypothetical protein CHGG_07165 [Chaetomium globosum CBS 148.51]
MADYDRRGGGGGSSYNPKKRRYRDDDEHDRRGARRRYDAPPHVRVRKQLVAIAENPMRPWHEEAQAIATLFTDNWDDELLRANFVDLVLQLAVEQPLKTPFVAAVVLLANTARPEVVDMLLAKLGPLVEGKIGAGEWREAKLYLKLLACLQGCLEGEGVFPVLEELFARAVDLQTASSEDTIGTEIVKIILLTLPYIMVAAPGQWVQKAVDLMEKTEIIASEPQTLQALIEPYQPDAEGESPPQPQSLIGLLQSQLQNEANNGSSSGRSSTMPRNMRSPPITIPETVVAGPRPLFPEIYLSVYAGQDVESVPPLTHIAASVIRDALLDTINVLHINRNVTARHLIDLDCYFSPRTFAARATPFDKLRDIEPPKSTWKPEDVAVDAVFSQLFQLPTPEQKLVYYHSVLTEACKLAPAAIAPSLGRAIRHLYRNTPRLDLELSSRFVDWFAHHLSNFGFTWKWTEWVDDVSLPDAHPRKAFIAGALDKEIRLSFAQRIKNTLPDPYKEMISPEKEKDMPDFKFSKDGRFLITLSFQPKLTKIDTPFAAEGREIAGLLKRKADDEEIDAVIQRIQSQAIDREIDALVASTDVFVTCVLHVGSKSLSHVLAAIERTKDRLADAGAASDAARSQIISATMAYWSAHPGVALSIIEKLLNYSILTPETVITWALVSRAGNTRGEALSVSHVYEMVFNTVIKVTGRVRQLVAKPALAAEDEDEIKAMRALFAAIEDALASWASGSKDEMIESSETEANSEGEKLVRSWGARWLRVFRRRAAIEEAFLVEAEKERARRAQAAEAAAEQQQGNGEADTAQPMEAEDEIA